MAGGVVLVLGVDAAADGMSGPLVGDFTGTGMVGGRLYVRGRVRRAAIGLNPPRDDVLGYLHGLWVDGVIPTETWQECRDSDDLSLAQLQATLPETVIPRLARFYTSKYTTPPQVEYRPLLPAERVELHPRLAEFAALFGLANDTLERLTTAEYTVIHASADHAPSQGAQPAEE
jgi:hypothetical protein